MSDRLESAIRKFVTTVASENGFMLTFIQCTEPPPTVLILQPIDNNTREGPDHHLIEKFVGILNAKQADYGLLSRMHIESFTARGSSLSCGTTIDFPNIIHLVRISSS